MRLQFTKNFINKRVLFVCLFLFTVQVDAQGSTSFPRSLSVALFATMGTAIAIFLIVVVIYLLCRKRRKQKRRSIYISRSERTTAVVKDGGNDNEAANIKVDQEEATEKAEPVQLSSISTQTEILADEIKEKDKKNVKDNEPVVEEVVVKSQPIEDLNQQVLEKNTEKSSISSDGDNIKSEDNVKMIKKTSILERKKSRDDITFQSGWRKVVKLMDLANARLITEETIVELETEEITVEEVQEKLKDYLVGRHPIAGVYNDRTEEKLSLYSAYKARIISRGTALSLLEAQAATGSIIDPINGDMMSVDDALKKGLLDRSFAAVLARAERGVTGYILKGTNEKMSLFQAMQAGFIVEKHGIRLLEAQIATGGIIDPIANHRLPVDIAFEKGLFDQRLNKILDDPSDDTKGFLDPNTGENLTYLELIERCINDAETDLILLPLVKVDETHLYKDRSLSRKLTERLQSRTSSSSSFSSNIS